jgi:hypothetical protein
MSFDLPPDERERIRAEEIFREEVRRELEQHRPPKNLRSKIWNFVNTSLGIWLLSSVGLGLLVWSWTLVQEYRHTRKANEEKLVKVNYEIYRDFWDFYGYAHYQSWNYEQYEQAHKKSLQRPEYKLSDFKDNTMEQLLWIMGEIPPLANKTRAQGLLRIVESLRKNVIKPLEKLGDLDAKKKADVDQQIEKVLQKEVGPLVYPGQDNAFIFK